MSDAEIMLVNEARRLARAIPQRKKILLDLQKRMAEEGDGTLNLQRERPQRYSIEFPFVPGVLQPQEKSFVVDGGSMFHCHSVESSFRVIGAAAVDDGGGGTVAGQNVQATLPWGSEGSNAREQVRQAYFDYFFEIRDTGSDREWQNSPQPSMMMLTGPLSGLWLPIPARIVGGSEVFVNIDPFLSLTGAAPLGLFETVSSYVLHVSFFGTEVTK